MCVHLSLICVGRNRHFLARLTVFGLKTTFGSSVIPKAVLGPPDVSVSGCGNCLLLQFKTSTSWGLQQMINLQRELVVVVRRSRDGAQVRPTAQEYLHCRQITYDLWHVLHKCCPSWGSFRKLVLERTITQMSALNKIREQPFFWRSSTK